MISFIQIIFLLAILFLIFGDLTHVIKQSKLFLLKLQTFFKYKK